MQSVPPWDATPELMMWHVISCLITLPGLVATCALHWSIWLHRGSGMSTAWQGISAVAPDQAFKEEACSGNRTPIVRRSEAKRPVKSRAESKESLTAPRSPFYKPRAKGGVMSRKRSAVAPILLYWTTAARSMPCQAP